MAACGLAEGRIFMIGGWEADTGKYFAKDFFWRKLKNKGLNYKIHIESLDVVASYDYEKDEWGEEGSLGLARGSSDAAVVRLPRSYWTNKLF